MMRWRRTAGAISRCRRSTEIQPAAHQGEYSSAFHQRLSSARRTAIADVFVAQARALRGVRLRGHHQVDGKILHVRGNQNLMADRPQFQNRVAADHRLERRFVLLNGAFHDRLKFPREG